MNIDFPFVLTSVGFGIGLSMDAFSISLADGLNEPKMKSSKIALIAGTFGVFQTLMPLIGWICVHTISEAFESFRKFIPWIALALLLYLGIKMIYEGVRSRKSPDENITSSVKLSTLLVQGVATSIDALSVGFTISDYSLSEALAETIIIGFVTFIVCILGVLIGKKFGTKLAWKSTVLGGIILAAIGIEIFITGIIG